MTKRKLEKFRQETGNKLIELGESLKDYQGKAAKDAQDGKSSDAL